MFSKTWDVAVKFNVQGAEMVMPGESGIVQLIMQKQMVCMHDTEAYFYRKLLLTKILDLPHPIN